MASDQFVQSLEGNQQTGHQRYIALLAFFALLHDHNRFRTGVGTDVAAKLAWIDPARSAWRRLARQCVLLP
jgi:hypothetical protein